MNYTIANLEKDYELELDRIVSSIKELETKDGRRSCVLVQLPDGLKPGGPALVDYLEEKTDAKISIWLGSCFGACDLPIRNQGFLSTSFNGDVDLVIQFGHARWS